MTHKYAVVDVSTHDTVATKSFSHPEIVNVGNKIWVTVETEPTCYSIGGIEHDLDKDITYLMCRKESNNTQPTAPTSLL